MTKLKTDRRLPAWARLRADGCVVIDPDRMFPAMFKEVGAPADVDRYWLAMAKQFAKFHVQRAVAGTDLDPRREGRPLHLKIVGKGAYRDRWALANFPEGRGEQAALQGKEARDLYRQKYGFVPQ